MSPPLTPAEAVAQANIHCAAQAREHARDAWIAALFAPQAPRSALHALACFDFEIRAASRRAREPQAAALRLAWWREAALGERDAEANGSPAALALLDAVARFALSREDLAAMVEARFAEIGGDDLPHSAAFASYASDSEGARLRLAVQALGAGRARDAAEAHAPAGLAMAAVRTLLDLPAWSGAGAALVPADMLARAGANARRLRERSAEPGVVAALGELRALARASFAEAERRLADAPPEILPAFAPLAAVRLDLERLERGAARPFEPPAEIALWRRQWAIWRWTRRR